VLGLLDFGLVGRLTKRMQETLVLLVLSIAIKDADSVARLLYRGRAERWLSVLFRDPTVIDLYAARVSGTLVLADQKRTLLRALGRYLLKGQPLCWS